ncbi:MAG: efflux RND transporter periplasmic adaptor subunit [Muribaculaceae bacterium]|nr:efflux RND transporter periplasmic adaptor subunit [Muribaculaceae bacterium]
MSTQDNNQEKHASRGLLVTMGIVVLAVAAVAIIGFVFMNKPEEYIEGQVEGTTIRISGKLAGRVEHIYVREGDTVRAGDTLVHIHSSVVEAQLAQAEAMREVAAAQNRKVDAGTRIQIINAAADLLAQAEAAVTITRKTYDRMERLFNEGVISEQKRDEARAAYDAAVAGRNAAESQLSLARSGAQSEDRQSAAAMVDAAGSTVDQVQALLADSYLTAPVDGTIDQIFPEAGELVAMGAPVMSLLRDDDRWVTFNVREELLTDLTMGKRFEVMIPAMGQRDMEVEVYYIRDMGSYATWRATKSTGSYDSRTFQVKARPIGEIEGLRPGMSVIYNQ